MITDNGQKIIKLLDKIIDIGNDKIYYMNKIIAKIIYHVSRWQISKRIQSGNVVL